MAGRIYISVVWEYEGESDQGYDDALDDAHDIISQAAEDILLLHPLKLITVDASG